MKRVCIDNPFLKPPVGLPSEVPNDGDPGQLLREFLVMSFSRNAVVTAAFVGELCHLITNAGGRGVTDLAWTATNKSRRLKLVLAREYTAPDLYYVKTPLYNKKAAARTTQQIPIHLPSEIFQRELEGQEQLISSTEPELSASKFQCKAWLDHEVRSSSNLHWSRIIPCSLYWDGFLYGVRESAVGVYIRNLRTGVQYLMAILRRQLSLLKKTQVLNIEFHVKDLLTKPLFLNRLDQFLRTNFKTVSAF